MAETPLADRDAGLPPSLRLLKWLVIVLTLSMIGGVITVVGLIVTRMPQALSPPLPALPAAVTLPQGTRAEAATFGRGFVAVVVSGPGEGEQRVLVYGSDGRPRGEVRLDPP